MIAMIDAIIIFGGGCREVAIAKKLKNKNVSIYYCADNENHQLNLICKKEKVESSGTSEYHKEANKLLNSSYIPNDIEHIKKFINMISVNCIVIGQEKYLDDKYISIFDKKNIPVIGPKYTAAKLELSKTYARNIIRLVDDDFNPKFIRYGIIQDNANIVDNELVGENKSFVIKPDGITGGKGVKIYPDHFKSITDAREYIHSCKNVLVEERLEGQEFSLMCFTDSVTAKFMPPVQDYKRALEGDKGLNTGSMGSVCDNVNGLYFLNEEDLEKCKKVMTDIIHHMSYNEAPYKGILYGSFMKTTSGKMKIIEFNARFGDPEAINVLSLLETNLYDIFKAINDETLSKLDITFKQKCNAVIYIVPRKYGLKDNSGHSNSHMNDNDIDCSYKNDYDNDMTYKIFDSNKILLNDTYNKKYLENVSSYIGSMDVVEKIRLSDFSTKTYLELTKSRAYALLFESDTLSDCDKLFKSFFSISKNMLDCNLRYRRDIISGYLVRTDKNKYSSIAGIDTNLVAKTLEESKTYVEKTYTDNVKSEFGQFSGGFSITPDIMEKCRNADKNVKHLELMASTDGVGTKIILLENLLGSDGYFVAGQDIVNHNINDILVDGGQPLFFLDYYGCNQLIPDNLKNFIKGCSHSCVEHGVSLLGGETALMKDIYKEGTTDLTGTIVGYKRYGFHPNLITKGDVLVGIPSSGFHTNGYSLLRKYYDETLFKAATAPHRCYLELIYKLTHCSESSSNGNIQIKALSHITGGGYHDNLKRVLKLPYELYNFDFPPYYNTLLKHMTKEECINTFNCGYGLVIICSEEYFDKIKDIEYDAKVIGKVL